MWQGNAIQIIHRRFTPDYVAGKLEELINSKQGRRNDAGPYLYEAMDMNPNSRDVSAEVMFHVLTGSVPPCAKHVGL